MTRPRGRRDRPTSNFPAELVEPLEFDALSPASPDEHAQLQARYRAALTHFGVDNLPDADRELALRLLRLVAPAFRKPTSAKKAGGRPPNKKWKLLRLYRISEQTTGMKRKKALSDAARRLGMKGHRGADLAEGSIVNLLPKGEIQAVQAAYRKARPLLLKRARLNALMTSPAIQALLKAEKKDS